MGVDSVESKSVTSSITAYATRSVSIKNSEMSPERQDQKQRQQEMQNSSNIDLKFFMEENNEEAFYATLDDQDSINSENLTNFQKPPSKNDEVRCKPVGVRSFLRFLFTERATGVLVGAQ